MSVTLDLARITKFQDLKNKASSSGSWGGPDYSQAKTGKETARHEVSHGIDAMADIYSYHARTESENEARAVKIEKDKSRWNKIKTEGKFTDIISNYKNYDFKK
ncbi:MAG: hypothetical protein LC113_10580 [Acidobacteria bacterium]|nr:hypothetical protein [Acidobacteriota bacterium]